MKNLLPAFLLLFLLPLAPAGAQTPGEEASMAELARRALSWAGADAVQLSVGSMPEEWPDAVELPEGTEVIGAVRRSYEVQVFLDAPQPADQVMEHFQERFIAAGWQQQTWPRWGFVPRAEAFANVYCEGDQARWLNVTATDLPGRTTDVRITVNTGGGTAPCSDQVVDYAGEPPPLPMLILPSNARSASVGSGVGERAYQASATFVTEHSHVELLAPFDTAMTDFGWQVQDEGVEAVLAWRTYIRRDEQGRPWRGQLLVTNLPDTGRQNAYVVASREEG